MCVSFFDIFKQKGFKLKGGASIVEPSESARPIVAPSYWLFVGITEQDQVKQAMKTYGVKPEEEQAR